jgi:uncharacterized membrane protein SirB2
MKLVFFIALVLDILAIIFYYKNKKVLNEAKESMAFIKSSEQKFVTNAYGTKECLYTYQITIKYKGKEISTQTESPVFHHDNTYVHYSVDGNKVQLLDKKVSENKFSLKLPIHLLLAMIGFPLTVGIALIHVVEADIQLTTALWIICGMIFVGIVYFAFKVFMQDYNSTQAKIKKHIIYKKTAKVIKVREPLESYKTTDGRAYRYKVVCKYFSANSEPTIQAVYTNQKCNIGDSIELYYDQEYNKLYPEDHFNQKGILTTIVTK